MLHQLKNNISESNNILEDSPLKFIPGTFVNDSKNLGNDHNFNNLQINNIHHPRNSQCEGNISCYSQKIEKFYPATQKQLIQNSQNTIQEDKYNNLKVYHYPEIFQRQCQFKTQIPCPNSTFLSSDRKSSNYSSTQNFNSTLTYESSTNPYSPSYNSEINLQNYLHRKSPKLLETEKLYQSETIMHPKNYFLNIQLPQSPHINNFSPLFSPTMIETCSNLSFEHLKSDVYWERYNQSLLNNQSFSTNDTNLNDNRIEFFRKDNRH